MSVHKFDEIQCQVLKVSGANKIENAVDVTQQMISGAAVNSFQFTLAEGATEGLVNVTISLVDANDNIITGVHNFLVWVSDDAQGEGVASTWIPDTITASTGTVLISHTANKILECQTDVNGVLTLVITDAEYDSAGDGYVAARNPLGGIVETQAIVTADYNAGA